MKIKNVRIFRLIYVLLRRLTPRNLYLSLKVAKSDNYMVLFYVNSKNGNFGDDLNPWLVLRTTVYIPVNEAQILNFSKKRVFFFIGSILRPTSFKKPVVIGAGAISSNKILRFNNVPVIHFVRGPLTRKLLSSYGYDYNKDIFGDPALLLPLIYQPITTYKFILGIVPHYCDEESEFINNFRNNPNVLIIDIKSKPEKVINDICSCKKIISSSLHGLIVSDAYSVESKWIKITDCVSGGEFKFVDYLLSVKRKDLVAIRPTQVDSLESILKLFSNYEKPIIDFNGIVEALPVEFNQFRDSYRYLTHG